MIRVNNGVDNNVVVEPVLTPIDNTVTTAPPVVVTADALQATVTNTVPAGAMDVQSTAPISVVPETVPATVPEIIPAPKKKKSILPLLVFLIIVGLGVFAYYTKSTSDRTIRELRYQCSPLTETKEEKSLDVNSTLVQDLYHKVYTSIREDYSQPEWNDTMKIYLAYRQISEHEMYDSNCNLFSRGNMEPYTCVVSTNFVPKAFKSSTLRLEWKKLFGENTSMPLINIKLQNGCIGGFEYIAERDEYVQGYCKEPVATSFKVDKKLTEAVSSNNTIILKEEVEYHANEKMPLPSYLVSGTYYYTFKLDMNYNYILISKKYDQKY